MTTEDSALLLLQCARCHYIGDTRQSIYRHLTRQHPCYPIYSSRECHDLLADFEQKWKARRAIAGPKRSKDAKSASASPKVCCECGNTFAFASSLSRHKQTACKGRSTNQGVPTAVDARQPSTVSCPQQAHTINNNNSNNTIHTTNTINNNIIINALGNESLEHITPAFLDQCVRRTNKGIVELIERIHFDPDTPENCNIKATNVKLPLVKYNDGVRWKWGRKDHLLDQIVDRGHGLMQEHFDDNEVAMKDKMSDTMFDHIRKWMDRMQEKDKRTWESVITDIYILILNATVDHEGLVDA